MYLRDVCMGRGWWEGEGRVVGVVIRGDGDGGINGNATEVA